MQLEMRITPTSRKQKSVLLLALVVLFVRLVILPLFLNPLVELSSTAVYKADVSVSSHVVGNQFMIQKATKKPQKRVAPQDNVYSYSMLWGVSKISLFDFISYLVRPLSSPHFESRPKPP